MVGITVIQTALLSAGGPHRPVTRTQTRVVCVTGMERALVLVLFELRASISAWVSPFSPQYHWYVRPGPAATTSTVEVPPLFTNAASFGCRVIVAGVQTVTVAASLSAVRLQVLMARTQ